MEYQNFKDQIRLSLEQGLPGDEAQYMLAPSRRVRLSELELDLDTVKKAGVLALIENRGGEAHFVLTERTKYPGAHSGQISFPGGRFEEDDNDFAFTAQRETNEEIGLSSDKYQIFGPLTELYIPPSNFLVHPFLALADKATDLQREEKEVAQIHRIPVAKILDDQFIKETQVEVSGGFKLKTRAFIVDGITIWGATAMIISEIRALALRQ